MIIYRYTDEALGLILSDNILIKVFFNLMRRDMFRYVNDIILLLALSLLLVQFVLDDVIRLLYTQLTDMALNARNED